MIIRLTIGTIIATVLIAAAAANAELVMISDNEEDVNSDGTMENDVVPDGDGVFCDIDDSGSCYDRNDNAGDFCLNYPEYEDFCKHMASESSPYDSGYNHGCDDSEISNPNDRYINGSGTGPSSHSEEFMEGYYDGFDNCGGGSGRESDESERGSDSGFSLGKESGGNGESDESETVSDPESTDLENAESTLPIPEITQRIEAPSAELKEEFVMRAEYEPSATFDSHWDPTGFGFDVSIGSDICPQDDCEFLIEEGKLRPDFTGGLLFEGRLKVSEQEEGGTRSKTYDMRGELVYEKTLGTGGGDILTNYTTDILKGKLKIGSGILVGPAPIEYNISKGYFYYNENEATLILEGARDQ